MSREDFRTQIEKAVLRLEQTAAPGWLADALRTALAHADALAPRETRAQAPADFFYPH